jgi:hypothetical protein
MGVLGLGCTGLFGDLAPDPQERCYPTCLAPDAASFSVKRKLAAMPEEVSVTVCRGGACEPTAELPVQDADKAPGGEVETTTAGPLRYSAYRGGPSPSDTLGVLVACVACEPFSAGEQVDIQVDGPDGQRLVAVRATLNAVTLESPRTDATFERDCPDVARRTCQELRPSYEPLE